MHVTLLYLLILSEEFHTETKVLSKVKRLNDLFRQGWQITHIYSDRMPSFILKLLHAPGLLSNTLLEWVLSGNEGAVMSLLLTINILYCSFITIVFNLSRAGTHLKPPSVASKPALWIVNRSEGEGKGLLYLGAQALAKRSILPPWYTFAPH